VWVGLSLEHFLKYLPWIFLPVWVGLSLEHFYIKGPGNFSFSIFEEVDKRGGGREGFYSTGNGLYEGPKMIF